MRIFLIMAALAMVLAGPSSRAWSDEKSHRAAAEEMLKASETEKVLSASIDQTLDMQLKANPQLEPVKDVMRKFLAKHLSYASIKEDLIKMHCEEFTEEEMKQIATFYKTPAGKKAIAKAPALMRKGSELGAKRVQDNLGELQKMIQEELRKQQSKSASPKID